MLDRMGGELPVMAALLFCKEIKKEQQVNCSCYFFFNLKVY